MVSMRSFTFWSWFAILFTSIAIYYGFMWAANYVTIGNTYATVMEMHMTPLYYLTIGLCVILCFAVDLFQRAFHFNILTSPSDFLREIVRKKLPIEKYLPYFEAISARIKTQHVIDELKKEA